LFTRVRELALAESIYRGRAISVRFRDDNGDPLPLPEIHFMAPYNGPVIFSDELDKAVERNVLTPIRFRDKLKDIGEPFKRGILLAGPYGTGKTLLSGKVARVAVENNCTFLYVPEVAEFPEAYRFAAQFLTPCVLQVEDIDRAAGKDRTDTVNEILNTVDGIDTKGAEIMHIMTTNHGENINAAMMRKGRTDVILQVTPPDPGAAIKLAEYYSQGALRDDNGAAGSDMEDIGITLAGLNPADIRESVRRARLEAMRRTAGGSAEMVPNDIVLAGKEVRAEKDLLQLKVETKEDFARLVGQGIGDRLGAMISNTLHSQLERRVNASIARQSEENGSAGC
jgi:transitional endoplasmic reticulum ATPase